MYKHTLKSAESIAKVQCVSVLLVINAETVVHCKRGEVVDVDELYEKAVAAFVLSERVQVVVACLKRLNKSTKCLNTNPEVV